MAESTNLSEDEIFQVAAAMPAAERKSYLDAACGGISPLRIHIEKRLESLDSAPAGDESLSPEIKAEIERLRPEEVGSFIGPYKLLQEIGQGGFGTVWMVEQQAPVRRRVALKVVKLGMDTKEVIARFDQERQALALMDHPNIARVFDAGMTPSGRPYFVMELVRGTKLTDFCDKQELPMRARLELFVRICHAVHHAHQKGIIHRDLKPSNILVGMTDGVPDPKVIDFGVAKATQSRLTEYSLFTEIGQLIGTPIYMSPEQAETTTVDVDTRSDVYSLGVLLYELLTGRAPFDREDLKRAGIDALRKIIQDTVPHRPSAALGTLDREALAAVAHRRHTEPPRLIGALKRDLDWIVMRAIEKDRNRRYNSAFALAEDIDRHLRSEPVVARPPTLGYRTRRLIMRNKPAFVTATIIAITLAVATVVSVSQAIRAKSALAELRATAPAFAAQARELAAVEKFDAAIEKLGYAIRLQPESADFRLARADILQATGKLEDAAKDYRLALDASPGNQRAASNLTLCEDLLASPRLSDGNPSPESLAKLLDAMEAEKRPAAEMMVVAKQIGRENDIALDYWRNKLRDLPNPTDKSITERLTARTDGLLELDLRNLPITDLSPLVGMPLASLNLSGCREIDYLEPLREMPLQYLNIERTNVSDLTALADIATITSLNLSHTPVTDLRPISTLKLHWLQLAHSEVSDLSPLGGMPIRFLDLESSRSIESLAPLSAMPLDVLNCSYINVTNFSPLANAPITKLWLQGCNVGDLAFLAKMPLQTLVLTKAKSTSHFSTLARIPTLKELALPKDIEKLDDSELEAIESLRKHATLERLSSHLPEGEVPSAAQTTEAFWAAWDSDIGWQRALRKLGITTRISRQPDGSWHVMAHNQPLSDLSIFKGANISLLDVSSCAGVSDLGPVAGLPLTTLRIANTEVSDLSPLRGSQIEDLWMANTQVTDLSPLSGLPLKTLFLDKCKLPMTVAPLAEIASLESLLLPERPRSLEKLRALPKLRHLSFTYDSKTFRPSRTAVEFWKEWDSFTWLASLNAHDFTIEQPAGGITTLVVRDQSFTDLSPLANASLTSLNIRRTQVTDLSPLSTITTLRHIILPETAKNFAPLRKLVGLERISTSEGKKGEPAQTAEEFWKNAKQ